VSVRSIDIILALKPKWAEMIYSGEKTVEVRRRIPYQYRTSGRTSLRVLVYETGKRGITGCFLSDGYRVIDPSDPDLSGTCIGPEEFEGYAAGSPTYGIVIEGVHRFASPYALADVGVRTAPQSFAILGDGVYDRLLEGESA